MSSYTAVGDGSTLPDGTQIQFQLGFTAISLTFDDSDVADLKSRIELACQMVVDNIDVGHGFLGLGGIIPAPAAPWILTVSGQAWGSNESAGAVRAGALTAVSEFNAARSIPVYQITVSSVNVLTDVSQTPSVGDITGPLGGLGGSIGSGLNKAATTLSIVAIAVIAVAAWLVVREVK